MRHLIIKPCVRTAVSLTLGLGLMVGTVTGMSSVVLVMPDPAYAGPQDDKQRVEEQLEGAAEDLDESSRELKQANVELEVAEGRLTEAREHLAWTQGRVVAARARDREAADTLRAADRAVQRARAELRQVLSRLTDQEHEIASFAAANYRQSSLEGLAVVLSSGSAAALTDRYQAIENVNAREGTALDRLAAARAQVSAREALLVDARRKAGVRRREAAENLARKRVLESRARSSQAEVERLVDDRERIRDGAAEARHADHLRYESLLAERARVEAMLREIARREAEAARRREAARREAERRVEEERRAEEVRRAQGVRRVEEDRTHAAVSRPPSRSSQGFGHPVRAALTSPYGMRFHPVLQRWKLHDGTDFGAACGTPVRAAASGRVVSRYYNGGYGNRVIISHGWREGASMATSYNHLARSSVRAGERVSDGEIIGYVGTTGFSTGCHLHFMVYRNGGPVNPMGYL